MEPRAEKNEEKKLDHASARIVAELAAQLLPPLRETLSEVRVRENAERDEAWRKIREALDGLAERRAGPEGSERWDALSRSLAEASRRLSALEEGVERSEALLRDALSHPQSPCEPEPKTNEPGGESPSEAVGLGSLSELMENRIPTWEGLLRAHSRAQSQELNALSLELAELQNEARNTLAQALEKRLRQELSDFGLQWTERLETLRRETLEREKSFSKMLWAVIGIGSLTLFLLFLLASGLVGS